jgi:hypothetical protein
MSLFMFATPTNCRVRQGPIDYRWALLGHEKKTVAEGYDLGFPVPLLKRWIDKIGF